MAPTTLQLTSSAPFQAAPALEPDSPTSTEADTIKPTPKVAGGGGFNHFKAFCKLGFDCPVRVTAAAEGPPVLVPMASTTPIHVEGCVPGAGQDGCSCTVERYILGGARSFTGTKVRLPYGASRGGQLHSSHSCALAGSVLEFEFELCL